MLTKLLFLVSLWSGISSKGISGLGTDIDIIDAPYHAKIVTGDRNYLCGGAIITSTHVLSASCYNATSGSMAVVVGSSFTDKLGDFYDIKNWIINVKLNVAVVEIVGKFQWSKTVAPLDVGDEDFEASLAMHIKMTGWAQQENQKTKKNQLMQSYAQVVPLGYCKITCSFSDMFCVQATDAPNPSATYGLGTIAFDDDKLVGLITIRKEADITANMTQGFAFTSVSAFRTWLDEAIFEIARVTTSTN